MLVPGTGKDEKVILFTDRPGYATTVEYLVRIDEQEAVVGRFTPEPGMNFVRLTQVFKGLRSEYRVIQECEGERLQSNAYPLWGA